MFKLRKKPEKPLEAREIPAQMLKTASQREMLLFIAERQEKQVEKLDVLSEKVTKMEQRFSDYIEHHTNNGQKANSQRKEGKDDRKWMYGMIVTLVLFAIKIIWDVWPK